MKIEVNINEVRSPNSCPEVSSIHPEVKITDFDVYSYDTDLVEELEREMELLLFKELGKALVQGHYDCVHIYPNGLPHSPTIEIHYHNEPKEETAK